MDIMIVNAATGRATLYKQAELRREAKIAVKGKGRLTDYFVCVEDGAPTGRATRLTATYQQKDGWSGQVSVAI